jgi:hypothetical protein
MTITEFLLARLDEDEAASYAMLEPPPGSYDKAWQAQRIREYASRTLAECEAKRRIIKWFEVTEDPSLDSMPWQVMKKVLACLTLPYANHPDYQQEWADV